MIRPLFPLADVRHVAEHAIAAPEHMPPFRNRIDGTTPLAALCFAGDESRYLMSTGLPAQPHPRHRHARSRLRARLGLPRARAQPNLLPRPRPLAGPPRAGKGCRRDGRSPPA